MCILNFNSVTDLSGVFISLLFLIIILFFTLLVEKQRESETSDRGQKKKLGKCSIGFNMPK